MNPDGSRLLRHLSVAVVIKLAVLAALWWVFIRDARVEVDGQRLAEHLVMRK